MSAQPGSNTAPLRVLLVDDERLARLRLTGLLAEMAEPVPEVVGEAGTAAEALARVADCHPDLVLLDIQMPGMDGMELARRLRTRAPDCALVFVTAHAEHALEAFEVAAVDYLTKPVRRERLAEALDKALRLRGAGPSTPGSTAPVAPDVPTLRVESRGREQRLPVPAVLLARAEWKYVTLHTAQEQGLLWDGTLNQLEERYADHFLRVHRSALVARAAVRGLRRAPPSIDGDDEGWQVQVDGVPKWVQVSRRQLPAVRQVLRQED